MILDAAFVPQPCQGGDVTLALQLSQPATLLRVELFTRDLKRVARVELSGGYGPLWCQASLDLPSLANGLYYATLSAANTHGQTQYSTVVKLMVLR